MDSITIIQPDDFHLHLRDEEALNSVVHDSARQFARAIIMPNLRPPVTTVESAMAYRQRILSCLPEDTDFQPLMTLYLTEKTRPEDIDDIANSDSVHAVKYYPAGATTNSDFGVRDLKNVYPIIERMQEANVPLLIHGEVTDPGVDPFDREKVFIEEVLTPLLNQFSGLKVVLEHITTRDAVEFVTSGPATLAATITPQHLIYNRGALFKNGLRPHHYCLPVLKREEHRQAVVNAATSGNEKFFLGTDSAPMQKTVRKVIVVVPGSIRQLMLWRFTPRYLKTRAVSISWNSLPVGTGQGFTVSRSIQNRSPYQSSPGRCPGHYPLVMMRWSHLCMVKHCNGNCNPNE